ncbi:DUF115 domain-containing protein, partial [bacterium]|nr:DUF115 domain-containing protein [bacterium]MBU1614274.1 DUF115 domain-containing protein [bacterium]
RKDRMNYYNSNVALLEKKEPLLYQRLMRVAPNRIPDLAAPSPLPPDLNLEKADIIIILGFGFGDHVQRAVSKASERAFILVIEPDISVFKAALSEVDFSPFLEKRVSLAIGEDPFYATRVRLDNYYGILTLPQIQLVEHNPSTARMPDYYQSIKKNLKEATDVALRNMATLNKFAPEWQKNVLTNLPVLVNSPGVNRLFGNFQNMPAIIVSAGPSLDKNVSDLKEAEGKALIVCVDTALKALLAHSIIPDLVVAIDSQEANYNHIKGLKTEGPSLVIVPVTNPKIVKELSLPVFVTDYGHPMTKWVENFIGTKGHTKVGGSVATTCFDLLAQLGVNPIIFIGQDLAYTDGKLHTGRTSYMETWVESLNKFSTLEAMTRERMKEERLVWVEGQDGNKVLTSYQMQGWITWLADQIRDARANCINATEGGAKIEGAPAMKLKEAIKRFCKNDLGIKKILETASVSYKVPSIETLVKGMKILAEQWEVSYQFSVQGKGISNELINSLLKGEDATSMRIRQLFSRIGMLYKEIIGKKGLMQIGRWSIEPLIAKMRSLHSRGNDKLNIAKTCFVFFNDMEEISKTTVEQLRQAQEEIIKTNRDF